MINRLSTFLLDAFHSYPHPLFLKNESYEYLFVNEAFAKLVGLSAAHIIGKTDFDIHTESMAKECRANDQKTLAHHPALIESLPLEFDQTFSIGEDERTYRVHHYLHIDEQGKKHIIGSIRDVSATLINEDILRETQKVAIGAFEYRANGKCTWSEGMYRMVGFSLDQKDSLRSSFLSVVLPEDREHFFSYYALTTSRLEPTFSIDYRIKRQNDQMVRWLRSTGRIEYRANGPIYRGITQDVTDLKTSESKQQETEKQLSVVLEMIDEVVWSLHWESATPVFVSPTAERFFGYSLEELMRPEQWTKIFPVDVKDSLLSTLESAAMSKVDTFSGEFTFIHPEKGERIAFLRGKIIRDEKGAPVRVDGMTSDVTENRKALKELEEHRQKLFALSKLHTLGELASGIGHEINTPLSAILSKIARAEYTLQAGLDLRKDQFDTTCRLLRESMEMVQRVSKIVDGLKQLSRNPMNDEQEEIERFDPTISLDQALSLSRARFSNHGFRVEINRSSTPIHCKGNSTTLFQVLVNLLNNSFDALNEKQKVRGRDGSEAVRIGMRVRDNRVLLQIADTGIGIDENFRPKLFDAFQSTKPEGAGTGLGLNISRRLLRALGGDLYLVSSEIGRTEFEISLPLAH